MTKNVRKSTLWKVMLALCIIALSVTLCIGSLSLANLSGSAEEASYIIDSATVRELGADEVVYSDLSPEQIKGLLVVTGHDENAEDKTPIALDASLYDVFIESNGGKLVAGAENSVSVAIKGSTDGKVSVDFTGVNVTLATATASIVAIGEFKSSGNYFVNGDGYYAFVQGMTAEQVESRLAVKLVYPNHTEYKSFSDGVNWATSAPSSFGDVSNNNDANIDIELTVDGIDDTVIGSVTFAASKTVGLKLLDGWKQPENITPATVVASFAINLQGFVVETLNSGFEGRAITVENDLSYSGLYVGATADALLSCKDGDVFDKVLEIPAKSNGVSALKLPLKVTYTGFENISSSLSQSGLGAQTARSEKLDLGEVYATVIFNDEYGDPVETQLYLKDITVPDGEDSPIKVTFYEGAKEVDALTRQVTRIRLTYTTPSGSTATRTYQGVQISPMTVYAPTIKATELTYSDQGCSTEMDGLLKDDPAYGDDMIISSVSDGAEVLDDGKTIKFNRGGQFTITVTFKKGSSSDFVFQQGSGNGAINANDPTIVTYTVNVLKAPITVSVNGFQTEYQYGDYIDKEPAYTVHGVTSETMFFDAPAGNNLKAPALPLPDGYVLDPENNKTNSAPSFLLYYTGTLAAANDGSTDYESYEFPKERGHYKVHVITAETGWYDAGELKTPFEFDIVERKISLGDITIPTVKYTRGTTYTLDKILGTVTVGNLVNPDDKNSVLEWDWDNAVATEGTDKHINGHVGNYTINFTIKNPNYKWQSAESDTIPATFKIEALNLGMSVALDNNSFVYGDVNPTHTVKRTQDGVAVDSFYAVVSSPSYYKVEDGGTETLLDISTVNTWDVGTYKVKYTASVDTANGDKSGDYNTPSAEATFTITKRTISQVKLDLTDNGKEYKGSAYSFAIVNSDNSALSDVNLVNGQKYADILTVALNSALLADGETTVDVRRMIIPSAKAFNGGIIAATDAGTYSFKVTLDGNYTWGGSTNDDGLEEVTLSFNIKQATVEIKWAEKEGETAEDWNTKNIEYTYDGNAHYPVLSAQDGLTLEYIFMYTDKNNNTVTVSKDDGATSIIDARTYWVKVEDFSGEALTDAAYTVAVNYVLPATPNPLNKSFVIGSSTMKTPTLTSGNDSITVTYNGKVVDFTSCIVGYNADYMLGSTPKLAITFDGNAQAPKNVKGNEDAYTVTITPAGNFQWAEGEYTESETEAKTYTLIITKLTIEIEWKEESFVQNGLSRYVYNGQAQTIALNTNYTFNKQQNNAGDYDDVSVLFAYTGSNITDGNAINVGVYTVTANDLDGADANNYTLTNAVALSHSLEITPRPIAAPVFTDTTELTFNGVNQTKDLTLTDYSDIVTDFNWNDVISVGISGVWNFDGVTKNHSAYAVSDCFSYGSKTQATFTFTNAGDYSLTFAIENDNYVWADGGAEKELRFAVKRDTIKAPSLGEFRAMEWEEVANLIDKVGELLSGVEYGYSVVFGKYDSDATDANQDTIDKIDGVAQNGVYYILLSVTGDADKYNYQWINGDPDDEKGGYEGSGYLTPAPVFDCAYTEAGAQVKVYYAITAAQVKISFTVDGFMFGENGHIDGITDDNRKHGNVAVSADQIDGGTVIKMTGNLNGAVIAEGYPKISFSNSSGDLVESDLVNGLPWNADTYAVKITVQFEGDIYQEWKSSEGLTLTIAKRPVNVEWKLGESTTLSTTYNGVAQGVTATVTNMPKSGNTEIDKLDAPTLTWTYNGSESHPTNAGTYTLAIAALNGDNKDNFITTGGVNATATFTIKQAKINLGITVDGNHVYGNEVASGELEIIGTDYFMDDAWKTALKTKIKNGNGVYVKNDDVGIYTVTLTWNGTEPNADDKIETTNYIISVTNADFEVVARQITLTFDMGKATSVYGTQADFYQEGINKLYTVEWTNGVGAWLVESDVKSVFTLSADISATTNVGNYPLTMEAKSGNYVITIGGATVTTKELGDWVITPVTITTANVESVSPAKTYKGQTGYTILGELVKENVTLTNDDLNKSSVKWYYKEEYSAGDENTLNGWMPIDGAKQADVINKNYHFMVTADNHSNKYVGECAVVIGKAIATVQISLNIKYGEISPDDSIVKYLMTLDALKTNTVNFDIQGLYESRADVAGLTLDESKLLYTVNGYSQGANVGNSYTITFNADALKSDNYTFENVEGSLTVEKLVLTVTLSKVSTPYYTDYSVNGLFGGKVAVELPESTYGIDKTVAWSVDFRSNITSDMSGTEKAYVGVNVFTLDTSAYEQKGDKLVTKSVGNNYDITCSAKDTDNYTVVLKGELKHEITKADLILNTITGYKGEFDQENHSLVIVTDKNSSETTVFAEASDDSKVTYKLYVMTHSPSNPIELDWENAVPTYIDGNPANYMDAAAYDVYYYIYAENYNVVYGRVDAAITQATSNKVTAGEVIGWTYGKYDASNNANGYQDGNITKNATAQYYMLGAEAQPVYVSIARVDGKAIDGIDEKYESIEALFDAMWAKALFNAGKYVLTFTIDETDNYVGDSVTYEFEIAKKTVTITPNDQEIVFGSEVPAVDFYTYTFSDFVNNGKETETWASVLGDKKARFTTDYVQGHGKFGDVGTYGIKSLDGDALFGADSNYVASYSSAMLEVTSRKVTVEIVDLSNTYNLNGGTETAQTLKFKVTNGSFYEFALQEFYTNENQSVIVLRTLAFESSDNTIKTNNVLIKDWQGVVAVADSYPVYAIYGQYSDGVSYSKNYEISFRNCNYGKALTSKMLQDASDEPIGGMSAIGNAGNFTITQALLEISPVGVYHFDDNGNRVFGTETTSYYSGAANFYEVSIADKSLAFKYYYQVSENGSYRDLTENEQIINVGQYRALVRFESSNYVVSKNEYPFSILQSTLILHARDSSIQYGTTLKCSDGVKYPMTVYGKEYADGRIYDTDNDNRFKGFAYDVISDTATAGSNALLPSAIIDYIAKNVVGYASSAYNSASVPVNTKCSITPTLAGNDNIKVEYQSGDLSVEKRQVTVTVRGYFNGNEEFAWGYYKGRQPESLADLRKVFTAEIKSFLYLDEKATFGDAAVNYVDLGITLDLPADAIHYNADGYAISYSSNSNNYAVTFTNDAYSDTPIYMIKKALLDIYANTRDAGGKILPYYVVYGNNVSGLTYAVAGMENGESFEGLLLNGAKISFSLGGYAAWDSSVGTTYTISVNGFGDDMADYDLINSRYHSATLSITPRSIIVTTPSELDYEEEAKNVYNGGVFGKEKTAVLTFADANQYASDEVNTNINDNYRPKHNPLIYFGNANDGTRLTNSKLGPNKAGTYAVTVTLNDNNYVLVNPANGAEIPNATLNFTVNKKVISDSDLVWYETTCQLVDGGVTQFTNYIANYVDDIMEKVSFAYSTGSGSSQIELGNASTINSYYINEQGQFCAFVEGRGTYTLQLRLKDEATNNYEFNSKDGTIVISYFTITSSSLTMDLSIVGWTYSKEPNAPVTKINGSVMSQGVTYNYARITGAFDASLLGRMLNADDIKDLTRDSLAGSVTFNAGYYLLSASYSEIITDEGVTSTLQIVRYYIFEVSKLGIELPELDATEYKFNGQEQSLTVTFDSRLVRVSYDGRVSTVDNGIIVYATNAGSYEIKFALINTDNYEWNSDETEAAVIRNWVIGIDDGENDGHISVPYSNEATFGDVKIQPWTVKQGYGDNVQIYFAKRINGQSYDTADWSTQAGLPAGTNAGNYWIKLVLSDTHANFTSKTVYAELTVNPKTIFVTPSGTVIYGDDWSKGNLSYNVDGLLYGNKADETEVDGIVGVRYALGDDYGALQAGGDYVLKLKTDANSVVIGLDAGDNYVIKSIDGKLTVNRRAVTVNVGNATSQYGRDVDLSRVSITYQNNLAINGLVVEANADITNATTVGRYQIGIKDNYDKDNYDVVVNYGTYTITARRITISLVPGGGTYNGKIVPVTYDKVLDDADTPENIMEFVKGKLTLTVYYSGLANDGNSYSGTVAPKNAGTYTATVRGSENENFVIIGEVSTSFVISKMSVDGSLITIANQTYTGEALTPVFDTDAFVAKYGADVFELVASSEQFINANTYTVRLRIKNFANYKWQSVEVAEREYSFTIDKANNELTSDIVIAGWNYGQYSVDNNLPTATVKFGQGAITFLYSDRIDGTYTSGAPVMGDVGDYWVKVTVPEDGNYKVFTSDPVKFAITKRALAKPTLTIITEGESKNDTYTGEQLVAAIVGYDMALMNLVYDDINVNGGQIIARATNAGTYEIKLSIANTRNYCWQGTSDNEITLTWVIAPKAIARPTENTSKFIVNGKVLTYVPEGFDEETMTISGNETAYGGEFLVTVGLKDKSNYVWIEGDTDDFTLTWNVVGINTVFTVVASILGGAGAAALIALGIQLIRDKRRRRLIDLAIDARSQAEAMKAPSKSQAKTDEQTDKGGND